MKKKKDQKIIFLLRQHRTELVLKMRRQIFRQIV